MSSRTGAKRQPANTDTYRIRENYETYVDGNTVRKIKTDPQKVKRRKTTKKAKLEKQPLRFGYIIALTVSVVAIITSLIMYVSIQADILNSVNTIASMEEELNSLKLANDETYTKLLSSVDLEKIKYIAITELGMTYADEGQVVTYSGNDSDYCIQYSDIPEN